MCLCFWSLEYSTLGLQILEHAREKSKTFKLISSQNDKEDPWPEMGESQGGKNHNEEVRWCFNNIPNIETYIIRRTSRYIGKVIWSEKTISDGNNLVLGYLPPERLENYRIHVTTNFSMPSVLSGLPLLVRRVFGTVKSTNFLWNHKTLIPMIKPKTQNFQFNKYELLNYLHTYLLTMYYM